MLEALATVLLLSAASQLDSSQHGRQPLFTRLDRDGNGSVSLLEARHVGMTQQDFSELDRDEDGRLSPPELESADGGTLLRGRPERPRGWPQY